MADQESRIPANEMLDESSLDIPLTRRQKLRLFSLVILKRLRFFVILLGIGVFIGYWDTVKNYWDKWTQPRSVAARELDPAHEFYCPMDPQVIRSTYERNGDVPKCPICGMPLSIREKAKAAKLPEGITGRVQLSPERIQLAGIETSPVKYRPMVKQLKTVGIIAFDESRLSRIVSRVDGYVEKLYVDKTYMHVRKGDPLAEIYSPELFRLANELVLTTRGAETADITGAARTKLQLLGVSDREIDAIVASGQSRPRLVIRSPQTGYVIEKKIVAGASVEAKTTLFEVADLSAVWIEADVYEKDISLLRVGLEVEATVESYPNRVFSGKLALIYPRMDAATRTNRIRLELDNRQRELRPGMFASVQINVPLESIESYKNAARRVDSPPPLHYEFLVVPERAVVDTGSKKIVYVERKPGMFEGVAVELGPRSGKYYPVLKGLKAGDNIASAGGFLIDAETRLNPAAASTYFGASAGPQAGKANSPEPKAHEH